MKRVYVNEEWCLGCHLCEYHCAYANSGKSDMIKALKGVELHSNIRIEEGADGVNFAVACRHCKDPHCVKACISGALHIVDGMVAIDSTKCVGCYSCIAACPYGAISPSATGAMQKCELCVANGGTPACVSHCPNNAIVFEERECAPCM